MKILVMNAGSSSHKLSLYDLINEEPIEPLWSGVLNWGRKDRPVSLSIKTSHGNAIEEELESRDLHFGLRKLLSTLWQGKAQVIEGPGAIERIGHRVVHGGSQFDKPTYIDKKVKECIKQLIPLAPLHNTHNLKGIEWMEEVFPSLIQIAVFDTSFHLTMPECIKTYPIPWEWKERGIQRYGFHGISHQYCAERIAKFLKKETQELKMINCHLGNGCSLCAIRNGKSYETTMGFTPLEGLMMGTRSGSIDPGILLYLLRENIGLKALDKALNFDSGLQGVAGNSDMRDILNQKGERAILAVDMFVHRLKTAIGALAISLEGFNVLNFTAGIGENAVLIREKVCQGLACLGLKIDDKKNQACQPDTEITALSSTIRVLVLHTHEDWMIARACLKSSLKT